MAQNDADATDEPNTIDFQTDRGADVTVAADSGRLFVTVESPAIDLDQQVAHLERAKGMDVLNCGTHRIQGNKQVIQIPVGDRKAAIEQLAEDSKDDSPLTYTVEEYTKTIRSWGKREITKQRLVPSKGYSERTEREKELTLTLDTDRVPDDAEPGDVLTLEDLVGDTRTAEEKDQDALDEAAETGEEVVIKKSMQDCNDPSKECNLDHVIRVATPGGEIETRRHHTY